VYPDIPVAESKILTAMTPAVKPQSSMSHLNRTNAPRAQPGRHRRFHAIPLCLIQFQTRFHIALETEDATLILAGGIRRRIVIFSPQENGSIFQVTKELLAVEFTNPSNLLAHFNSSLSQPALVIA